LQEATTLVKATAFLVLIAAGIAYVARHGAAPVTVDAGPAGIAVIAVFIVAMQSVIYTFDGWTGALYFAEEVRDPGRDIPRATFGGLLAITAIYLLVNAVFVTVIPMATLAGDPLAAGTVARTIFGASGDNVIRIIIVVAMLSSVNALLPIASRVLFAMGRDRLAPQWTARINVGGTPTTALLASSVVAVLFLFSGTVTQVIAVLSFFFVATYTLSFLSVFVLRRRDPDAPRPYRARGHPWTTAAMLLGSVVFLAGTIWSDPRNGVFAGALVALSYPIYRIAGSSSVR